MPAKKQIKLVPGNLGIADWVKYLEDVWHIPEDGENGSWLDLANLLGIKVERIRSWFAHVQWGDDTRAPTFLEQMGIVALLEKRKKDGKFRFLFKSELIRKCGSKHERFLAKHSAKFSPHITFEESYYDGQINDIIRGGRGELGAYCKVHDVELEMTWNQLRRGAGCAHCTAEKKQAGARRVALAKLDAEYAEDLELSKEFEYEEWRLKRMHRRYEDKKEVIRTAEVGFLAAELARVDRDYRGQ